MMNNLIRIDQESSIWPYSLDQLRLDEPTQSFSLAPNDSELAYYGCFRIQESSPPDINPASEKVVQAHPIKINDTWTQQWEIVPLSDEEKAAYYFATHPPRWLEFAESIQKLSEINNLLSNALQSAPALAFTLSVGLGKAADGNSKLFVSAWREAWRLELVTPQLASLISSIAVDHDIPAEIIAELGV